MDSISYKPHENLQLIIFHLSTNMFIFMRIFTSINTLLLSRADYVRKYYSYANDMPSTAKIIDRS